VPILEILRYPDLRLSKVSKEVKNLDGRVAGYLNSMVDTMYAANGIGLAAPQVGILENAVVIDIDPENRGKGLIKLINPQIVESSGEIAMEEGCLSVVNFTTEVARARKILVRGWTPAQREVEIEAEDLAAVCIQHELDHLQGKLLTDHISRLKRELYRKRLKRAANDDKRDNGSERGSGPLI
jgi:peptide deformylase